MDTYTSVNAHFLKFGVWELSREGIEDEKLKCKFESRGIKDANGVPLENVQSEAKFENKNTISCVAPWRRGNSESLIFRPIIGNYL